MPQIQPSKIVSYSSEDKAFPAHNLLKASSFCKWRSEKGGTKQEIVELGFDEPVEVCRLDIGNNGSAFIEVLVRRSAASENFTVLLPSSSFLSPPEAKSETNLYRVRVFSGGELQTAVATQKWDIFRFVCSQPFNKNLPYGISFVSFHSSIPKTESASPNVPSISVDSEKMLDELQPGALFKASKIATTANSEQLPSESLSVAEKLLLAKQASVQPTLTSSIKAGTKPSTSSTTHNTSRNVTPHVQTHTSTNPSCPSGSGSNAPKPVHQEKPSSSKHDAPTPKSANSRHPLRGVVFSLSGYQNPTRSEIRQRALNLGATFRQNWTDDCTHLVCAFPNTPKFREVQGRAIIISEKWIEECHRTHSRVNWRPYRVGRAPSPPSASTDTGNDETALPEDASSSASSSPVAHSQKRKRNEDDEDWRPDSSSSEEVEEQSEESIGKMEEEHSTSEETEDKGEEKRRVKSAKPSSKKRRSAKRASLKHNAASHPEEEDTDDEIQRAMNPSPTEATPSSSQVDVPVSPPKLPNIFEGKHFFIYNKAIPSDEERLLSRLIVAFDGTVHQYMHPDVQYAITRSEWNEEFDEALATNSSLIFVRPDWVFACDEQAKWVPFQKFLVQG